VDEVNAAVKKATESEFKGLIGYTEDPIVSSDLTASGETLVFDSKATMIAAGKLVKTISWFDNGWGFGKRVLDVVDSYASLDDRVKGQL
jgi:glyceraldehyde 3-phosphate dehydrogenase